MSKQSQPVNLGKAAIFFAVITALLLIVGYTLPATIFIIGGWIFAAFTIAIAYLYIANRRKW